jgi:hypothetical protein
VQRGVTLTPSRPRSRRVVICISEGVGRPTRACGRPTMASWTALRNSRGAHPCLRALHTRCRAGRPVFRGGALALCRAHGFPGSHGPPEQEVNEHWLITRIVPLPDSAYGFFSYDRLDCPPRPAQALGRPRQCPSGSADMVGGRSLQRVGADAPAPGGAARRQAMAGRLDELPSLR